MSSKSVHATVGGMLSELITYLSTPCERYVRSMGYLSEAIALRSRYRRCSEEWQTHLDNSRRTILEATASCRNHAAVVILGAGPLLDVPLKELAAAFQEVVLVDIVHLTSVRRSVRRFANVRLIQYDVSTVAQHLFRNNLQEGKTLPEPIPADDLFSGYASLVVSLNILSQLPVLPRAYARAQMPGLAEQQLDAWCRRIIAAHFKTLGTLNCDVCLITDQRFRKLNRQGALIEQGTTLSGFELPEPNAGWTWCIAPLGELSRAYVRELSVGAWFWRGASPPR